MKRLVSVLAAVVVASGLLAVGAYAAKEAAPAVPSAEVIKKGKAEAPAAIAAAGLQCNMKNAAYAGSGAMAVDKKKLKFEAYEVACDNGLGYIVEKFENGTGMAHNCVQSATAYEATNHKASRCTLPENADLNAQMQLVTNQTGAKCTVNNETWVGGSDTAKIDRYEVGCSEGSGYLVDVPYQGPPQSAITCLQAQDINYECKFTPKEARIAPIIVLAAQADKACQVSGARYVGASPDQNQYFEVGCTGKPGFMLETKAGALVRPIPCVEASGLGGGCKLTDMAQLKAGVGQSYVSLLAANHITCTSTDFVVIGKDPRTQRDAVEFKCAEHPNGLVAMIVGPGAKGRFESFDCFGAYERGTECTLTKKPALLTNLKPILTAIEKVCEPTDFLVHGPDDAGDGDLVEVKCGGGQPGYILDLPPDAPKTIKTLTCDIAARGDDKCQIPGNK